MNINRDALADAMEAALEALAQRLINHEKEIGKEPPSLQHCKEHLARAINSNPGQYIDSDSPFDISVQFNAVALLLNAIVEMQDEITHLSTYEAHEEKMAEIISAAWEVFSDKRETDRNKYNQAVLNVLGFKQRPANINYRVVSEEFDQMDNGARGWKTAAYKSLADKYRVGVDAIRKGIKRYRASNP